MRTALLLFACVLAHALSFTTLVAQYQSPPAAQLPWNGYTVERIPQGTFQSIQSPRNRLGQSQNTKSGSTFELPLPFNFYFIDRLYPAGWPLAIGIDGYIAFNGATSQPGSQPYLYYDPGTERPHNNLLIMAYWFAFRTSGGSDGIYATKSGQPGDQVLTIEWRVRLTTSTTSPPATGAFQVKLFERTGTIAINYGPASLDLPVPDQALANGHSGAVVGIKNYGQDRLDPTSDTAAVEAGDQLKFMIVTDPRILPDTTAITRLPTMRIGDRDFVPEWDAGNPLAANGHASNYFHYAFPALAPGLPCAYRIVHDASRASAPAHASRVPIENTQGGKGIGALAHDASDNGKFIGAGVRTPVTMTVRNGGAEPSQPATITGDIVRRSARGRTATVSARLPKLKAGDSVVVPLLPPLDPATSRTPGRYRVTFRPQPQDGIVSTAAPPSFTFFIRGERDVMPIASSAPHSSPHIVDRYRIDSGLTPIVVFKNTGVRSIAGVGVGYRILNERDSVVGRGSRTIAGPWPAGATRKVGFATWHPSRPGRYRFETFSLLGRDDITANDTLPERPSAIAFDIVAKRDVGVGNPDVLGSTPSPGGRYPRDERTPGIPVRIAIRNNGLVNESHVTVQVAISDRLGLHAVNGTATIAVPMGYGAFAYADVPAFVPPAPGRYHVHVSVTSTGDADAGNNVADWDFEAVDPGPRRNP